MSEYAILLQEQGKYDEAEALFVEPLRLMKRSSARLSLQRAKRL
jgi:hypothetical protein